MFVLGPAPEVDRVFGQKLSDEGLGDMSKVSFLELTVCLCTRSSTYLRRCAMRPETVRA